MELVVTSLSRYFEGRMPLEVARSAALELMGAVGARAGRPISWDEREDAPLLREEPPDGAFVALVRAAVHLDDLPGAGEAWRAIDPARDEAVELARMRIRRTRFPHLVRGGRIFLPVGFDRPIECRKSPFGPTAIGSSFRLLAELEQIEDELGRGAAVRPDEGLRDGLRAAHRLALESVTRRLPLIVGTARASGLFARGPR